MASNSVFKTVVVGTGAGVGAYLSWVCCSSFFALVSCQGLVRVAAAEGLAPSMLHASCFLLTTESILLPMQLCCCLFNWQHRTCWAPYWPFKQQLHICAPSSCTEDQRCTWKWLPQPRTSLPPGTASRQDRATSSHPDHPPPCCAGCCCRWGCRWPAWRGRRCSCRSGRLPKSGRHASLKQSRRWRSLQWSASCSSCTSSSRWAGQGRAGGTEERWSGMPVSHKCDSCLQQLKV